MVDLNRDGFLTHREIADMFMSENTGSHHQLRESMGEIEANEKAYSVLGIPNAGHTVESFRKAAGTGHEFAVIVRKSSLEQTAEEFHNNYNQLNNNFENLRNFFRKANKHENFKKGESDGQESL